MPGHALHIELAREVLETWPKEEPPLDIDSPDVVNAMFHGAVGPDMGYYPGADPLLSDLAHYIHTAGLGEECSGFLKELSESYGG